jgi:hypothetical protein
MEDDFRDYEDFKEKLQREEFKSKTSLNMNNPSAFMTPGSQKIEAEGLDMLQGEVHGDLGTYLTPRRQGGPESSNEEEHMHRSNEYINSLLNNILPEKRREP